MSCLCQWLFAPDHGVGAEQNVLHHVLLVLKGEGMVLKNVTEQSENDEQGCPKEHT